MFALVARTAPRDVVASAGVGPDRGDRHNPSLEQGGNYLPSLAADIKAAHDAVERNALAMAERAIDAGRLLLEAKKQVKHGGWLPWLQDNVGMSERTARRYMTLAKAGIKSATVADLGIVGAAARAQAIAAAPLPGPGKYLLGAQADEGRYLVVWHDPNNEGFLHHAFLYEDGITGSHRAVRSDRFLELLHRADDGRFDYTRAEYFQCAHDEDRQFLDRLHDAFWQAEVASWSKLREVGA